MPLRNTRKGTMAEGGRQSVILLPGLDASEPPLASSDRLPSDVSSLGKLLFLKWRILTNNRPEQMAASSPPNLLRKKSLLSILLETPTARTEQTGAARYL